MAPANVGRNRCTTQPLPQHLQTLKDKWWTDDSTTETLPALATWRAELDDHGQDPREELAFQHQLTDYSQHLRQRNAGTTKTWKPGPTPPEWAPPTRNKPATPTPSL
jgi:hypothetical protein